MDEESLPRPPPPNYFTVNSGSEYTADELEFLQAIDAYKRRWRRPFPSWKEILAIVYWLGYRKVHREEERPRHA